MEAKKAHFLRERGVLRCEVCGFQFADRYPEDLATGFIEVHHIVPLEETAEARMTELSDLMLVCPNCHRMIHRTKDAEGNLRRLMAHFGGAG